MKKVILLCFLFSASIAISQDGIHYINRKEVITADPENNSFSKEVYMEGDCVGGVKNKAQIYFGELQKPHNIKASYTLNESDKWRKVSKKKFITSSLLTSAFYTGIQKTRIPFPEIPKPYRFRYSYEMENEDLLFLSLLDFSDAEHTDTFSYEIILPDNFELHYQINDSLKAYDLVHCEKSMKNGKLKYAFSATPNKGKSYPRGESSLVRLIVTPKGVNPFVHFNNWYASLVRPNTILTREVKAEVEKQVIGLTDDMERIQAIFDLIKDRTSYIAIENGIGAVMPRDVNEIWTAQQGDCKDMSNLLCQSLRAIGYDAQLALSATIGHTFDLDFPSLSSANHVICVLKFNGEWLYMDATEREGFFGYPSRQIQGRNIFIVDDIEGELHLVPKVKATENKVSHQLGLTKNGNALTGTAEYNYHGLSQIDLRSWIKQVGSNRLEIGLESYLENQSSNLNFTNVELSNKEDICRINAEIYSERNFTNIRKKYYLSLAFLPFPHGQEGYAKDTEVNFYKTEYQQFTVLLKLDAPVQVQNFEPVSIKAEGMSFEFNVIQKERDQIEINYKYVNELLFLNNEAMNAFREINILIKETLRKSIIYEIQL